VNASHLDTSNVAAARRVEFRPSLALTSGSDRKADLAIRLVNFLFRQKLKCVVSNSPSGLSICCPEATESEILQRCAVAERRLGQLQDEPLTAKMVEEILAISSAERRRWSKDGRLPNAGRASFNQGKQRVSLFVYPPDVIRELATRPDRIAEWRRRDAAPVHIHSNAAH
jgi:hypothetical protein